MHFYPLSFEVEPGQRKVHTALEGKKIALSDVRVTLHSVRDMVGCCGFELEVERDSNSFTLQSSGDGWDIEWTGDLERDTIVVLEAQGSGGQLVRSAAVLKRATPKEAQ